MTKQKRYEALVAKRKTFTFKDLHNISQINEGIFDCNHVDLWSQWQGNLDAKILVIGQDWGDINYLTKHHGKDGDNNKTNQNLRELLKVIDTDIDIGLPNNPTPQSVFLTNAILGIKGITGQKQMSGSVKSSWIKESTEAFTKALIDIIQPRIIITLGAKPLYAMRLIEPEIPNEKLSNTVGKNPIILKDGSQLFAFYHCGGLGLANRKLDLQKEDWKKIKPFWAEIR